VDGDSDTTFELTSGQTVSLTLMEKIAAGRLPDRPDLAEVAVQDAVVKLLGTRTIPEDPDKYAARAVHNAVNSVLDAEKKKRNSTSSIGDLDFTIEAFERATISSQLLQEINRRLKGRLRTIATLLYDGLDKTEIAERLRLSRQTIQEDVKKIKKIILEVLGPIGPPTPPKGGGGSRKRRRRRGGVLPPARADPVSCARSNDVLDNVVVTRSEGTLNQEAIHEKHAKRSRMERMGLRALQGHRLRADPDRGDLRPSTVDDTADALKRLLLRLPAFRDEDGGGNTADPEPGVRNLEEVIARVLSGERDDQER